METVIVKPDVEMDSNMNIVTDTVSNVYIYKQVKYKQKEKKSVWGGGSSRYIPREVHL